MATDSPYHNSPPLNSPSKRVTLCYLFVRMDSCNAVLLVCSSDSLFSDVLSLLPSCTRELTLISVNRNVFTVNSLWIFPVENVLKRPLRQLLNSILPWEDHSLTQTDEMRLVAKYFFLHLLWMLGSNSVRWLTWLSFCVLFVDLHCSDLERKLWEIVKMSGYVIVGFAPQLSQNSRW